MSDARRRIENLSPKRLMLLALELQAKLEDLEQQRTEPIAIVGIGCHLPGAEGGPEDFWQLLRQGRNAISEAPEDRWDNAKYYDANVDSPGRMATKWGGFLSNIYGFDAPLFGIAGREANSLDPQHRMLLEVCWEALEHGGHSPREFGGSATGVFVGIAGSDYQTLLLARGDETIDAYVASGTASSIAAGRISYALGLQGPSIAVDTACSASLVAVHLACQSLRTGECRQALAGGVNAILSPKTTIALSRAHMMASDGRCKAFDSRADGFVRSEGCGMVVLKRLSDAVSDGDHILAVIRGSAVNQDGRSSGITAPNGMAQEALIRAALAQAGVRPEEIGYVEAHGTGTSLGDPIEAHALAAVLGPGRDRQNPLVVGSVKTNLGHLEAAAGIAGLIKAVLVLGHEFIPPHLHFESLNPHIDWEGAPVEIPVQGRAWPRGERRRLAGVSSFGFSGTNAHVVLEEAPQPQLRQVAYERPVHLLALTARTESALRELGGRYADVLEDTRFPVGDLCFTANAGRAHFEHRLAVTGASAEQLRAALLKAIPGRRVLDREGVRPVFLFPGQGAQFPGMGKQLYDTQPVFRAVVDECASLLQAELETPLLEVLWGGSTSLLDQTAYSQPGLFAIEYALAALWRSWGIEPGVVVGHSVGEYVAACVAEVYSLADGLKLIARRGRLMQGVAGQGAMAAVRAPEGRVRDALRGLEQRVAIAAINAPESLVISGYEPELQIAEQRLKETGVTVQRLNVSHAFHSPQMREMEEAFEAVAREMEFQAPRLRLVSSVTGRAVAGEEMRQAEYWRRQVSEPVRFREAMETLRESGDSVFLEVGPGATLTGLGQECIGAAQSTWLASLRRNREEWPQMLDSLGQLYVRGAEVNWAGFDQPYQRRRVPLPTYPFERQRYWFEAHSGPRPTAETPREITHPVNDAPAEWFYEIAWQPAKWGPGLTTTASAPESAAPRALRWLIVPDSSGLASDLSDRILKSGGQAVVAVSPEDIADNLRNGTYDFVLYLATSFSEGGAAEHDNPAACQTKHLGRALEAAKAIVTAQSGARLWMVTSGAQPVLGGRADLSLLQASLWGLGRTIALEHPDSWGGLLDLDPIAAVAQNSTEILSGIQYPHEEDQLAFRNGQPYVSRLLRRAAPSGPVEQFMSDKTYLITGGLGGLGLEVAKWMAGRGARNLALVGRRAPSSEASTAIEELRQNGTSVEIYAADVSSMPQMEAVFRDMQERVAGLGGIIHCAGVLDDGILTQLTPARVERVLAPKVAGAWNLHRLTAERPLEFFVLFSSVASIIGSSGQASYAAANGFLDGLANYRRSHGLTALTINWGGWAETGMAARSVTARRRATPLKLMPTASALAAMGAALSSGSPQMCIAEIDWALYKSSPYRAYVSKPFFSRFSVEGPADSRPAENAQGPVVENECERRVHQLLASPPENRKNELVQYLVDILAPILGVRIETIDPACPITDFGLDSLMALEFRNRINSEFDVAIPTVFLLRGPCVEELADQVAANLPDPETCASIASICDSPFEFPLSFGQQEWWFGHKIMPGSAVFNVGFTIKASPGIEWSAFERAVGKLTARHAALRTAFVQNEAGIPMQRVLPDVRPDVTLIDASSWSEEKVKETVLQEFQRPLDLDRPLFSLAVFRQADGDVLFFKMDHIIIDHWSTRLCLEDLRKLYTAELNGTEADMEPIRAQYRDFVEWEKSVVEGPGSEALWEYWKQKLGGELPILRLPSSDRRSATLMAEGRAVALAFDPDQWTHIQRIAREHRATGYSFLLAAFQVLLYRYTGQEDIVVGTSASGREDPRWESLIGLFINLLPLRTDLSGNPTFLEYLGRVRDTLLGALDHQAFPFSLMVQRLRPARSLERIPVFQSFFNFVTNRSGTLGILFEGAQSYEVDFGQSKLRPYLAMTLQEVRSDRTISAMNRPEVMMELAEIQGQLVGYLNFNSDALDRNIAEAMAADYCRLLDAVIRDPNQRIDELLPAPERAEPQREEILL